MSSIVKSIPLIQGVSNSVPAQLQTTSTSYTNSVTVGTLSRFYWDADVYDGTVAVYIEAILKASATDGTAYAQLTKVDGTAVTGSEVSTSSTAYVRVRSGDIFANLVDNTEYHLRLKSSATTITTTLSFARAVITQSGTITKTESCFELASVGVNSLFSAQTAYTDFSTPHFFYYDSSKIDGTVNIYLESTFKVGSTARTAYLSVYDTSNNQVASSEISTSSTSYVRVRSSAITLTNGSTYKARYKSDSTNNPQIVFECIRLIIQQSSFSNTESYFKLAIGSFQVLLDTYSDIESDYYWDNDEWSVTSKSVFYESTLKSSATSVIAYSQLWNGASELASVTTTSTTPTRVRSTAITPTDNTNYTARVKSGSFLSNVYLYSADLIVQANIGSTPVTGGYMTTNKGWWGP